MLDAAPKRRSSAPLSDFASAAFLPETLNGTLKLPFNRKGEPANRSVCLKQLDVDALLAKHDN